MKIGRNELCHCGSGQKYKTCCMRKDRQATHEKYEAEQLQLTANAEKQSVSETEEPVVPRPLRMPEPPPDPHMEAIYARWEEFEKVKDYISRIDLFQKTLDEPELMDDENAFSMLNEIYTSCIQHGERERFDELVRMLRERIPDVYENNRKYCLQWLLSNAIANGRDEIVCSLAREIGEIACEDADIFAQCLDELAYHGKLTALSDSMQIAWPLIKDSSDVWSPDTFATLGADYVVFDCLERDPQLDARDPALIERARFYYDDLNIDQFADYVTHLAGRADRRWTMDDFAFGSRRHKRSRPEADAKKTAEDNLRDLGTEFSGYSRREQGVPYTKAALAWQNIIQYILDRQNGKIVSNDGVAHRAPDHNLCPDRASLNVYFNDMFDSFTSKAHTMAATWELIPAWLRFLEIRGLITADQHQKTLADLQELQLQLSAFWNGYHDDPALAHNTRDWPRSANTSASFLKNEKASC